MDLKTLLQLEKQMEGRAPVAEKGYLLFDKNLPFLVRTLKALFFQKLNLEEIKTTSTWTSLHSESGAIRDAKIFWLPHFQELESAIPVSSNWAHEKSQEIVALMEMYPRLRLVLPWPDPNLEMGPAAHTWTNSPLNQIRELNRLVINDPCLSGRVIATDNLVYSYGFKQIYEPRWDLSVQMPWSSAFQIVLGDFIFRSPQAQQGGEKRILAIGLDDVLWRGILGEDRIAIGNDVESQACLQLQKYLAQLKSRGVQLMGLSKNNSMLVEHGFDQIPGMQIHRKDFVAIEANWNEKYQNLEKICARLGVKPESCCFVDSDPVEVEMMREALPGVETLQLDPDPCLRAQQLKSQTWFWSITNETEPSRQFHADTLVAPSQPTAKIDELRFLAELDVDVQLRLAKPKDLGVIMRLMQTASQFNLTALQWQQSELEERLASGIHKLYVYEVEDKHGQMGVVGVISILMAGREALLENWLMTIRALNRKSESRIFHALLEELVALNISKLIACFIPNQLNRLVEGLLGHLGMTAVGVSPQGDREYELVLIDEPVLAVEPLLAAQIAETKPPGLSFEPVASVAEAELAASEEPAYNSAISIVAEEIASQLQEFSRSEEISAETLLTNEDTVVAVHPTVAEELTAAIEAATEFVESISQTESEPLTAAFVSETLTAVSESEAIKAASESEGITAASEAESESRHPAFEVDSEPVLEFPSVAAASAISPAMSEAIFEFETETESQNLEQTMSIEAVIDASVEIQPETNRDLEVEAEFIDLELLPVESDTRLNETKVAQAELLPEDRPLEL